MKKISFLKKLWFKLMFRSFYFPIAYCNGENYYGLYYSIVFVNIFNGKQKIKKYKKNININSTIFETIQFGYIVKIHDYYQLLPEYSKMILHKHFYDKYSNKIEYLSNSLKLNELLELNNEY